MVMDVTPSPQCVGREFVRQYYTLLNKAPTHVHRFYNNNSSFVHGGLEAFDREGQPAVGQKQIHQCIQELNFRDCHAKITQVDSQATLGNGVVVQVTGELSNGGQPMRRFTQTFVLGAQSPKQYYVHNDIFRYQDLVFGDEEPETDSHHYEQIDEEVEHQPQPEIQQVQVPQMESQYYTPAPTMPTVNGQQHVEEQPAPPASVPAYEPPHITPPPHMTSSYTSEEMEREPVPEPEEELLPDEPEEKPLEEPLPPSHSPTPPDNSAADSCVSVLSNEPKIMTYASTLVKSGGGVTNFSTSPNAPKSPPSPPPAMTRLESRMNEMNLSGSRGGAGLRPPRGGPGANMRGGNTRPPPSRPTNYDDNRDFGGREDGGSDGERRRSSTNAGQYSDDHQLFLGNLPLDASENDLRNLFKRFGTIVDLRIMSKPNNMKGQPGGNKVPNYGFIIFDSVQTVHDVLAARPIIYPGDPTVKLNVEEKKTRPRSESGGGRGGGGGARPPPMMRGSLSRGGPRGGFSRGSGGMRPGGGFSARGAPR